MPRNSLTGPLDVPRTAPLAVTATGPPAAGCPPVLALTAGAAAIRAPSVTPATINRTVQVLSIQISLQGPNVEGRPVRRIALQESISAFCNISHRCCFYPVRLDLSTNGPHRADRAATATGGRRPGAPGHRAGRVRTGQAALPGRAAGGHGWLGP